MTALFLPHTALEIGGVRCAIIPDAISTSSPPEETVLLSDAGSPARIFCSTRHLQEARAQFPGVPLYGFWQTLVASGIWRLETPVLAWRDEGGNGQYVISDGTNVRTGEVVGGQLVGEARTGQGRDIEIEWIDLAGIVSDLVAPSRVAETPVERLSRSQSASRGKYLRAGAGAAIAALGFLIGGQGVRMVEADRQETLAGLQSELARLEEQGRGVVAGRLKELPEQSDKLNVLLALTLHDPEVRIERGLLSNPLKLLLSRRVFERHYASEFDGAVFLQAGGVEVMLR